MSGFYGKITNFDKSAFKFDRIYSSRKKMEEAIENGDDGVFIGRYVLVDYNQITTPEIPGGGDGSNEDPATLDSIYGTDRNWDSTVWQKVYVRNNENQQQVAYRFIADLNTAMPTLTHLASPPGTPVIFTPKQDGNCYELQIPDIWDIMLKSPDFNVDGFSKNERNYVDNPTDEITFSLSHQGNNTYDEYYVIEDGEIISKNKPNAENTKELNITLQSIGNTICNVWDIIYGTNRNTDIQWNSINGNRFLNAVNLFDNNNLNTVSAVINSVHDLMGMIVEEVSSNVDITNSNIIQTWDGGKIYKYNNEYYIKSINYSNGQIVGENEKVNIDGLNHIKYNGELITSWFDYIDGMSINAVTNYQLSDLFLPYKYFKDENCKIPFTDFTEYIQYSGDIYKANTKSFVARKLIGFGKNLNSIHGWLIRLNHILSNGDPDTFDTNTVQGCINQINDIIKNYEDTVSFQGDNWIQANKALNQENAEHSIWHVNHKIFNTIPQGSDTINITPSIANNGKLNIPTLNLDAAGHIIYGGYHTLNDVVTYADNYVSRINIYNNRLEDWQPLSFVQGTEVDIKNSDGIIELSVEKDNYDEDIFYINHHKSFQESQILENEEDNSEQYYNSILLNNTIKSNYTPKLAFDEAGHFDWQLPDQSNSCSINFLNTDISDSLVTSALALVHDAVELIPNVLDINKDFYLPNQQYASFISYNPIDPHHIDIRSAKTEDLYVSEGIWKDNETASLGEIINDIKINCFNFFHIGAFIQSNVFNYLLNEPWVNSPQSQLRIDTVSFKRLNAASDEDPNFYYYNNESTKYFEPGSREGYSGYYGIKIKQPGVYKIWGQVSLLYCPDPIRIATYIAIADHTGAFKGRYYRKVVSHHDDSILLKPNPAATNEQGCYDVGPGVLALEAGDWVSISVERNTKEDNLQSWGLGANQSTYLGIEYLGDGGIETATISDNGSPSSLDESNGETD